MRARLLAALGLLLLGTASARADEVVLRGGRSVRGYARKAGAEIQVNEYGCSAPEMTLGVRRLRALDVAEIRAEPLEDHLQARLEELGPRDVARRVDLLREAQSGRLREWARRLAAEILRVDPKHEEALRAVGGAEAWQALRAGDPRLDEALAREVRGLLRLESGDDRRRAAVRLAGERAYKPEARTIERMARSARAPRGLQEDVRLRVDAGEFPEGRYSLYVPEDLDPLEPRPLLVALHGGGISQEKGAVVRGSARDALALYLEDARRLGWFLLCPTAVEAPWPTARNAHFVEAVLEEVTHLWNVDLQRVHLAGQGGGGDGAWFLAARDARDYASVAVASAGKPVNPSGLSAQAAIWMFHGDADEVEPIEPVRKAAERLLRAKADFVYCELPREGHGLPPAARRDMFRYLAPKRLRRARDAWPRPSAAESLSNDVLAAFGNPADAWGVAFPPDVDAEGLVLVLRRGRADAEVAARELAEHHRPDVGQRTAEVRAVLADRAAPAAARTWAAWLLGRWRVAQAVDELGDVLRTSQDPWLLRVSAEAAAAIASPDSVQDLRWALGDVAKRFRSVPGQRVPFQALETACRLGAAVADALGRCAAKGDDLFAEIEESLVRHVLMDKRPVDFEASHGEDPSEVRTELAGALARCYHRLHAETTLFDMLRAAVRNDARATRAVLEGMQGR